MDLQGAQDYVSSWVTPAIKAELAQGMSFSAIDGDEVLACAGVLEFWPGRATAWAILSGRCGSRFRPIHRAVSRFLDLQSGRIEATADIGFGPGHRWLQMLGFKVETECMKAYMPNGADAAMYVRGV
jgi:hypothetical protein